MRFPEAFIGTPTDAPVMREMMGEKFKRGDAGIYRPSDRRTVLLFIV